MPEGHDMMDNSSVVSDWKENFRLSQPTPSHLFEAFCFSLSKLCNKLLVNHSFMNVPGIIVECKRLGIRISFQCKLLLSEYSKFDESGNFYESGKISSSLNLV